MSAIFLDYAVSGLGSHGMIVVHAGEWHRAVLYAEAGRVRLSSPKCPAHVVDEINGHLAALFPLASLGARSRPSSLSR